MLECGAHASVECSWQRIGFQVLTSLSKWCADCGAEEKDRSKLWASLNLGVVLCIEVRERLAKMPIIHLSLVRWRTSRPGSRCVKGRVSRD